MMLKARVTENSLVLVLLEAEMPGEFRYLEEPGEPALACQV